jgi:hypothetical protein
MSRNGCCRLRPGTGVAQCERPGNSWYSLSAFDFFFQCLYFDLFTDGGMMWSDLPAMNSSGARSSLP